MKYKIKHEKSNKVFMSSIFILCLITCLFWILLREYIYFGIYFVLTLILSYMYYFTYYYLLEDKLIVRLGFIKIQIKYKKIKKIDNLKNSIKLYFNKWSVNIYPVNKDIFYVDLLDKTKGIK